MGPESMFMGERGGSCRRRLRGACGCFDVAGGTRPLRL